MTVYINGVSDEIKKTLLTTVGDTIYASAVSTPSRLGIGANDSIGQVKSGIPAWRTMQQMLLDLYTRYIVFQVPMAGWTETLVGAGTYTLQRMSAILTGVDTTASSSALLDTVFLPGFDPATAGVNTDRIDWDKWFLLAFSISKSAGNNALQIGRVQLKQVGTLGALNALGLGIRMDNLALVGESYGSGLGTVDLGVSVTVNRQLNIAIIHDPSVPKIEWYTFIGGVDTLRGTQLTATNIPSGKATGNSRFMLSFENGNPGVAGELVLAHPILIQAT